MSADPTLLAGCSQDAILRGRLRLWQPRTGYRFSVDALLLAHFGWQCLTSPGAPAARPRYGGHLRIADLGAGCGVVGLAVAERLAGLRTESRAELRAEPPAAFSANPVAFSTKPVAFSADLVELQERLSLLAEANVAENGLTGAVAVHRADLRALGPVLPGGVYGLVLSNPPFSPAGSGRASPDAERARATVELTVTLADVVRAAARLLAPEAPFAVIYPAERLPQLLGACGEHGLGPTMLRPVHPLPDRPASRILLAAHKSSKSRLRVLPPLVLHRCPGQYTAEARRILDGGWQ